MTGFRHRGVSTSAAARARTRPVLAAVGIAGALLACSGEARDLPAIEASGRLVALLPYNSTTYFLYRGEPMGYEYELLRHFAGDRELVLDVVPVEEPAQLLDRLRRGEADVAGGRLLPELQKARGVAWSEGLYGTRLAVVQRAVARDEADEVLSARRVESPQDLAGRTVHAPSGSAAVERLLEIADEISGDVEIVEVAPDVSAETLIRRVSRGEVELTATQRNLARLKKSYFRNILVRPALGPEREVAWAVPAGATALRSALDAWIADPENEALREDLYYKYFVDRRGYRERVESSYLTSTTGRLSRFDELIRQEAERLGWDWRLLASMVFQESRFDPDARSWAGAKGLLQLMPATARAYDVEDPTDPAQSLRGGVSLLAWLDGYWADEIADPDERLLFVLASFNVGQGHVADARRLAEAEGDDPDRWEDVAGWLIQKSRRKVYARPEVHHGFCRGIEPVTYVARVLERYAHYRHFVSDRPEPAPAAEAG
ncbi:MAG TPA: transglycosylase SLT domain-containing protein [Myxococcota bacterium]|nr:transglycosylase SLT domain-containing protein [Myxococcota bacterium]